MALSQGTNATPTAQSRTRQAVNYGAPSGPYAHSPYGPGPMQSIGGVPQYYNPQDMYNPMNRVQPSQLGPADMATKFMSGFAGAGIGMFQPSTYQNLPGNLNQMRKHPGDALRQMFTTPEGLGGLAFAGLTAPVGGGALGGGKAVEEAAAASAIPRGVQWAPGARAALDAHFGEPMEATTRAAMLKQAPSMAEILAEKTSQMDRIQSAMKFDSKKVSTRGMSDAKGGTHTMPTQPNPMEGKFFGYAGTDKHIDPAKDMSLMEERLGSMNPMSAGFNDMYDDFLDMGGDGLYQHGLPERPSNIHNIHDPKGNVMGSLTYNKHPDHIVAYEAYLRPEARGNLKYFHDLIKPLRDSNLPIDVTFANHKWAEMMLRQHEKGRIKLTPDAEVRARWSLSEGRTDGKPNSEGMYGYDTPAQYLPPLGDYRVNKINYQFNPKR